MTAASDPTFPALHGRPAYGWINDPNGVALIDDTWHVFYQYNPHSPFHDQVGWGHMSSTDLVHWRTEPVAIMPRPDAVDAGGCWTGCLVDDAGIPTLVYSAIDGQVAGASAVTLARATDRSAVAFIRDEAPAAGMPDDPQIVDVRDPFVLTVDTVDGPRRLAVQGAGAPEGTPRILVYDAADLTQWRLLGDLLVGDHPGLAGLPETHIFECPNLVRVGDDWLLVVSLWTGKHGANVLVQTSWILGDLIIDGDAVSFVPRAHGRLDDGPAFYAPQLTVTPDGRVVLWGWAWELDRSDEQSAAVGWQGVLTYPRDVRITDGRATIHPVPEIEALRGDPVPLDQLPAAYEIVADPGAVITLSLDGRPCWPESLMVQRILVDGSLIEVITADGGSYTTRAYPGPDCGWTLTGDLTGVTVYPLAL